MAKTQKCLRSMLYENSQTDNTTFIQTSSSFEGYASRPSLTPLEIIVSLWNYA